MEMKFTPSVSIRQDEKYSNQILELLTNTLWGTPGNTLYRHLDTEKIINDLKSPVFFSLERFGKLLCTLCLSGREINIGSEKKESEYVCYLAADNSISGNGQRKNSKVSREPHGMIKAFMEEIFSRDHSRRDKNSVNQRSIYYAYVESDNVQSIHLCNYFGFRSVRQLTTIPFSRFSPKNYQFVRKARTEEYGQICEAIALQYTDHNFLHFEYMFYDGNYFIAEADGKIVAGVQANPFIWSFRNLPGLSGKVLLKILPYIPYLRRIINPEKFEFSAFEGIFCVEGYEWVLDGLFESVLSHQKRNTALIWLDMNCPMIKRIRKNCKLGLMDIINSSGSGEIMVRADGFSDSDWELLESKPMYISCFDLN
jgi:hypothetical protein